MIATVAILNLLIAFFCFYMAFRVWRVRRLFTRIADTLIVVERNTHAVLSHAPEAISQGKASSRQARETYQQLEDQLQRARQALALLGFGKQVWKWKIAWRGQNSRIERGSDQVRGTSRSNSRRPRQTAKSRASR